MFATERAEITHRTFPRSVACTQRVFPANPQAACFGAAEITAAVRPADALRRRPCTTKDACGPRWLESENSDNGMQHKSQCAVFHHYDALWKENIARPLETRSCDLVSGRQIKMLPTPKESSVSEYVLSLRSGIYSFILNAGFFLESTIEESLKPKK